MTQKNVRNYSQFKWSVAVVLATVSCSIFASTISTSIKNDYSTKTDSKFQGRFELRSNQLAEDVGDVVGNQYYSDLDLSYKSESSDNVEKVFNASARFNNEEQLMFSNC